MTILILAEKPDQAKKYAQALGSPKWDKGAWQVQTKLGTTRIVSAVGHLVELDNPYKNFENWNLKNLPAFPETFDYAVKENTKKQFATVKKEVKAAKEIIIGTDPDREGEAIAYLILNQIPNATKKVTKRLWAKSTSPKGIQDAFSDLFPASQTINLYHEAEARSISDWLVGFNLSPFVTIKMKEKGILQKKDKAMSVGRVQTPIVSVIVDNDREIQHFTPLPFFKIEVTDEENQVTFTNDEKFDTKEEALTVLESLSAKGRVTKVEQVEKSKVAPELFNLSTLYSHMSKNYQIESKDTLKLIQGLYEKGYLSYPRSDSKTITENEFSYLADESYLQQLAKDIHLKDFTIESLAPKKRYVNEAKTGSHTAIIPTDQLATDVLEEFSPQEKLLYQEVAKRTLLMFEGDYRYQSTTVTVTVDDKEFSVSGTVPISYGWKKFEEKQSATKMLPVYQEEQELLLTKTLKEDKTKPPKRVTEESLLDKILPKYSLGTSATRAAILEKIQTVNYVKRDKSGKFFPLQRGEQLIDFLREMNVMYTNLETTKRWEEVLQKVGQGTIQKETFIEQTKEAIKEQIENNK